MNTCEVEMTVAESVEIIDPKQFVTYYTGTTEPSADLGEDGDIYLKVV